MSKKSSTKKYEIIHTNYGNYVKNKKYYAFVAANKEWQNEDPIEFELEVIERFACPPEE